MAFIPKSYLDGLILIPKDIPIGIVMRHAERFEIKPGEVGFDVPLTEDGKKSAFKLGKEHFTDKKLTVYSSAVGRCVDTGENILQGAKIDKKVSYEWSDSFETLKTLRNEIAASTNMPSYIIFSDKTLHEMAKYLPVTKEEMLEIHGVGEKKFEKYGAQFVELISEIKDK